MDAWWMNIRNAQAVRNRLKIGIDELLRAVELRSKETDGPVRILSLAAGAAPLVIQTVVRARAIGIEVQVLLVDLDCSALAYARSEAQRNGVENSFQMKECDVLFFNRVLDGFVPDIIEMMGLTDYLKDKLAIALIKKIRRYLANGGTFITCHVHPNGESYFLEHIVNWKMIYRTLDAFENIIIDGGFIGSRFVTEPHNIHSIAIAKKLV